VLRDTGCSGAILNKKYCPAAKLTGKHIIVHQIHANPLRVPLAEVYVDTPYFKGKLKVAVLDTIISDLIIGNVKQLNVSVTRIMVVNAENEKPTLE
jgi:hypothetical protein